MASPSALDTVPLELPMEIIILILHEACRSWPPFRQTLSLTCSWTRRLALPHLFSTVIITKLNTAYSLPKILEHDVIALRNPTFVPALHVRSLWVAPVSNKTPLLFTQCKNLTHVALQEDNFYWLVHSSSSSSGDPLAVQFRDALAEKPAFELFIINAKRPSWHLKRFVQPFPIPSPPLFTKISRLWIGKIGAYGATQFSFDHFTALTHVVIPYHLPSTQHLGSLLRVIENPQLTCIVLVLLTDLLNEEEYQEGLKWIVETCMVHPRLLALPLQHASLRSEWERSQLPGQSIWERAASFTQGLKVQP